MPTIYAVASVKGGVGKTTTTANLAATLAAAGYDTIAVDADLGSASLGPSLGVVPGEMTLHDVLAGEADPAEATREGPHGLAVLPGGDSLDHFRKAEPGEIVDVLEAITGADYVIVDTGAGLTHQTALPLSVADGVLLVSTPTRDGLANTRKTQELTEKLGGDVVGLALNEAEGDEDTGAVDVPVLGAIPDDPLVAEAQAAGSPLSAHAPDSDPAAAYRSLASSLTGEPIRPAVTPDNAGATPDDPEYDAAAATDDQPEAALDLPDPDADPDPTSGSTGDATAEAAEATEAASTAEATADPEADTAVESGTETEPEQDAETQSDADAGTADDAGSDSESAADPDLEVDDAVILDDDPAGAGDDAEDDAAVAARTTVLEGDEYAGYREEPDDPPTVEDAESGESAEIGEDVIPFAQQSKERTEQAKQESDDGDEDDEEDGRDNGGFLGRLFRSS
ncbi:MinD/ParA family ATP-binding protein [Halobaculum gomorrense]|uniref:Septum site-determining protein MinD n=1 Tax=Halobaculum gomorrense TaxID=43928 RepID=A0A1M5KFC0_9EURY|nr:P-loop NTPase [Halobaculum gomorrense]SHG51189.1 septum site-determining protein MinD [Halobaculum gomorrense]